MVADVVLIVGALTAPGLRQMPAGGACGCRRDGPPGRRARKERRSRSSGCGLAGPDVERAAPLSGGGPFDQKDYRYWPVFATVSIERPASVPVLPETSVRM
ncbi:hypothetical protein GCM10010412_046110 [Nonomuraea recticatena]|uniref:Uncharacterized protein n=1 Tax=Nonomuraea recticatena TaxID=46178 RepID=A0ABP6EH83_9ACTN